MPPQDQGQPASWDDYIQYEATQQGISPLLALAVARKESSLQPTAVGDSGKALGMFQLHAGAAKDAGGVDRSDPLQNIKGGVTYLKMLNERYKGDVSKTLQAYNGGMESVDKGAVSPAAQAYAAEVIANLSQGARQQVAPTTTAPAPLRVPVAGRGTATQNVGVEAKQNAMDFGRAYDPRTTEGRENLAGTAGSIGAAMLTRGMPVGAITTRIAAIVGPVLGAALTGGGERAVEESAGTAPSTPGSVTSAGERQGAYEIAGQVFSWPIRRVARTLFAPAVAGAAAEGIKAETAATRQSGRDAVDLVRRQVEDVARTTKLSTKATVAKTTQAASEHVGAVKSDTAAKLAQVELDHAAQLVEVSRQYDNLLNQPPSTTGTAAIVKSTVEGPSKRALDIAGQRVQEAAATGPEVNIKPVKAAITAMGEQARPTALFGQQDAATGIGFLRNAQAGVQSAAAASMDAGRTADAAAFQKAIAAALGVEETHPLPGLLGKIQQAPDMISFADAHQIKMLMDEAVNWDRIAKGHLTRITKGARIAMRETLAAAGHEPYESATAAYQAVVPLYRKGIGKQIIQLSQTPAGSSRVAQMLKSNDPISARTLKQLLVDQAAAGGDADLGHQAWDAVRSSYTYDRLIAGGIDKLGDRVSKLLTERPEFVRELYGDESGKQVLHNLGALAEAYSHAQETATGAIAQQKVAGKAAVADARTMGQRAVGAAKGQAAQTVEQGTLAGRDQIRQANRTAAGANQLMTAKAERFKQSTLAKFSRRTVEEEGADAVRAAALGLHSYWGGLSILRLLRSPASADLVQWMSYSSANTQRAVKILTSPVPPTFVAAFMKDVYNAFPGPATATPAK